MYGVASLSSSSFSPANPVINFTDSSGTPGNVTNNSPRGRCALAAGASTVIVTNSLVTANSSVHVQLLTQDGAATQILKCDVVSGSFMVTYNAASTGAASKFDFVVFN
jgi:hypothetical protein